jgi:uncharacterized membrane protein YczE
MQRVFKQIFALLLGTVLTTAGISLFYAVNIGTDPISVLVDGQHNLMNLPYGTVTLINNIILIVFGLIFARKYVYVGTIVGGILMGPLINAFVPLFSSWISETAPFVLLVLLLFPAVSLLGVGVAIVISINFGVSTMDILTLTLRDVTRIDLKWVKIGLDVVFTVSGFMMGGVVGVGTLIGVFLTGPIIEFALPHCERAFARWAPLAPVGA